MLYTSLQDEISTVSFLERNLDNLQRCNNCLRERRNEMIRTVSNSVCASVTPLRGRRNDSSPSLNSNAQLTALRTGKSFLNHSNLKEQDPRMVMTSETIFEDANQQNLRKKLFFGDQKPQNSSNARINTERYYSTYSRVNSPENLNELQSIRERMTERHIQGFEKEIGKTSQAYFLSPGRRDTQETI